MINIDVIKKKIKDKNTYRNFCEFIIGMLITSVAVSVFYKPNSLVTTGCTGLSILISNYIDIDLSLIVFSLSSILLAVSFCVFGLEYGAKNILGTILFPVFIKAASLINRVVNFNNTSLFLLILIGGVLSGIGFGIIKKSGYSLGGFYVIYDILNRNLRISVGKANLFCNIIIIFSSIFIFGLSKAIYSGIGLYISSYIGDKIILGVSQNKAFYIITNKVKDVKEYIINNLNYTVTVVNARGGYSDKKKKMILCVIPTVEYIKLKEVVKEIDKDAFFLVTDSYSVSKYDRKFL